MGFNKLEVDGATSCLNFSQLFSLTWEVNSTRTEQKRMGVNKLEVDGATSCLSFSLSWEVNSTQTEQE